MDKTTLGVAAALTAAAALPASSAADAHAAAHAVPPAASYAQLLEPIPNAVERLQAANAQAAARSAELIEAQYTYPAGRRTIIIIITIIIIVAAITT